MEESKQQRNGSWLSVPQFGDWDQKGAFPDYSLDFSKIREMRKQNKQDPSRASLGNEDEFINPTAPANSAPINSNDHRFDQDHSPAMRENLLQLLQLLRESLRFRKHCAGCYPQSNNLGFCTLPAIISRLS